MKILIPVLGFGKQGGYRVLSKLADAWADAGHIVDFLAPATSTAPYFPTRAKVITTTRNGLPTPNQSAGAPRRQTGFDNILSLYAGLKEIGARYDVVLANHSLTAWPVRLANCGNAKKVYYIQAYEHQYYPVTTSPIKHLLAKASYHLGLVHISNSRTYPTGRAGRQTGFVPPGIDYTTFFPRIDRPCLTDQPTITLGTIGRTEASKGTPIVLAAFEALHRADPRFRLKVAFGNLPSGWSHPAAEVTDIHGDAKLAEFYRSIDILMVGCIGQIGAPHYPVIEALACGTPVVHTGYFPGDNQNSWPVAQEDSDALSAGVQAVTNCSFVTTKTDKGIDFVRKNLGWPAVAATMLKYFD